MRRITLVFILLLVTVNLASAAVFFVDAKNGSDDFAGTLAEPFQTIERSQKAVHDLIAQGLEENVTVNILPGEYRLYAPLTFGPADSGTHTHSVTYRAHGKKPLIHGGFEITGFKPLGDDLWQAEVPRVKAGQAAFRSLFKNGQRQIRSRWPNDKCIQLKSISDDWKQFEFKETLPADYKGDPASELIIIQNWTTSRSRVAGLAGGVLATETAHGREQHPWTSATKGKFAWLEHDKTFVDTPGEWHIDTESGILIYKADANENPNDSRFVVPLLEQLIVIDANKTTPVVNLHFKNLRLAYTAWPLPRIGFLGIQAGYYGYKPHAEPKMPAMVPPAAIEWQYTRNCGLIDCEIFGIGATAVGLGAGCCENRIVGCRIDDIGITGISVGHRTEPLAKLDADWDTPAQVPINNTVENNIITRCGSVYYDGVGIFTAFTDGTRIRHNLIYNLPYVAIHVGYKWSSVPTCMKNCIVEYNRIFNVIRRLSDAGGIYTLGHQPGTRICGNLIYGIGKWQFASPTLHAWANNAFFFDAGSSGYTVCDNVVFDAEPRPVRFNRNPAIGGSKNAEEGMTWNNNYFDTRIDDPAFPWHLAARAGLTASYKHLIEKKEMKNK